MEDRITSIGCVRSYCSSQTDNSPGSEGVRVDHVALEAILANLNCFILTFYLESDSERLIACTMVEKKATRAYLGFFSSHHGSVESLLRNALCAT